MAPSAGTAARRPLPRLALAGIAVLVAAACSAEDPITPRITRADDPSSTVFLAQAQPAGYTMDALYAGAVKRDEEGCLRLNTGHTVVWPNGFSLVASDGGLDVEAPGGRAVGRVGGGFRFGGGEVPSADYTGLTPADAEVAATRCPGLYWVVGATR
ncbi:MAG TPA: hypothetical protein VGB92_10900 [Longimicrobium sp.]|jgi:hypothetical protein